MTRKFIAVAIMSASCLVGISSESDAFHRRRARHAGHNACVAIPAPACNDSYGNYASNPSMANCGCGVATQGGYGYGQQSVYGGNGAPHAHGGVGVTQGEVYGNGAVLSNQYQGY